jgi:hypothetical protein
MNYNLTTLNSDEFIIDVSDDRNYYNSNNELKSIVFNICDLDKDLTFEDFKDYFEENLNSAFCYDNEIDDLIKCIYEYYFVKNESKFKTGESLTVHTLFEEYSEKKIFQINFMLEKYPVIWNEIDNYKYNNTDYQLYISEISEVKDYLWKLELIMTKKDVDRYFLGGRFKFFVKKGDVINLKYYEHPLYNRTAEVTDINYNSVTLKLSGVSKPSKIHNIENRRW